MSFGEQMYSREQVLQFAVNHELCNGFDQLAQARGISESISPHSMLRPNESGYRDGSYRADLGPARAYIYESGPSEIPGSIRYLGVSRLIVESHTDRVLGDEVWPESVMVTTDSEGHGMRTVIDFHKREDGLVAAQALTVNLVTPENRYRSGFAQGLSATMQKEIIIDLFRGRDPTKREDPAGEYSRTAVLGMIASRSGGRPDAKDIRDLYTMLKAFRSYR